MADIDTAKIQWNSLVSTPNVKYMCLDIKKNYLTAALKYFEYMKTPLNLFPKWAKKTIQFEQISLRWLGLY